MSTASRLSALEESVSDIKLLLKQLVKGKSGKGAAPQASSRQSNGPRRWNVNSPFSGKFEAVAINATHYKVGGQGSARWIPKGARALASGKSFTTENGVKWTKV